MAAHTEVKDSCLSIYMIIHMVNQVYISPLFPLLKMYKSSYSAGCSLSLLLVNGKHRSTMKTVALERGTGIAYGTSYPMFFFISLFQDNFYSSLSQENILDASPVWDGCPKRDTVALERIQLTISRAGLRYYAE